MNLSISNFSGNNVNKDKNVSFGMAKFSDKGYQLASLHSDVYSSLSSPTNNINPDFFKKKPIIGKAPFTKYYISQINSKDANAIAEVASTVIKCGTSDNIDSNAKFISQLLHTEKYIHSSDDNTKRIVGSAVNEVFKKNWDNPKLSKQDTFRLLEIAKYGMDEKTYVTLNGVIQISDSK